ncbi:unnamed protein product [Diamesa tonsa]
MGKVMSIMGRQVQRFNVENRAHKVISQDKATAAPKYKSNLKDLDKVLKDFPEIVEQSSTKDSSLDDRLKKVFVTSSNIVDQRRIINPEKPLPLLRSTPDDFEYGFQETEITKIARGKCTLRQAIQFISDNQTSPEEWTVTKIANEYKVKEEHIDNIVKHFRTFSIYIPEKGSSKKILLDPKKEDVNFLDEIKKNSTPKFKN